jgi:GT2 family glycosyltransferase/glycosyltransferase involved in cell wall biosynthesis
MAAAAPPLSVVVVTWNAAERLPAMLAGLRDQAIEGLELIVVDNASTDGSVELIEREWPGAVVERQATNTGFSPAASRGVALSRGEAVTLLNYDVVLGSGYLRRCLDELAADPALGSIQGVLLRPGGDLVDSAGHQVSRGRWFRNRGENQAAGARAWAPAEVFGVTAAAAVYRRAMLEDVTAVTAHLFDPVFFAYLEDVDLDYRARWRGWRSAVAAGATAEHVHSGSGARATAAIQRHIIKNRLLVLYRNEPLSTLLADLPWITGHLLTRLALAGLRSPTSLAGVADFIRLMPSQRPVRQAVRRTRRTAPGELRHWFRAPREGSGLVTRTRDSHRTGPTGRRLLMVCGEPLGERMAGPAIRTLELARAAARAGVSVTIAAPAGEGAAPLGSGVRQVSLNRRSLRAELLNHDCVVVGASLLTRFPVLHRTHLPLAVDLYVPVPLEAAELFRGSHPAVLGAIVAEAEATQRLELKRADLVLCASGRQRDLYAAVAARAGRDVDASGGLFRVVPFGVPDEPPERGSGRLRRSIPGAAATDPLLLWGGGLHEWFEPELVVEAVAELAAEIPALRLVFLGTDPPNLALRQHGAAARAAAAARRLGVLDRNVFFLPGWVPYAIRGEYFGDADLGLSAHRSGPETTYSWRTRLLDYAWAGLPIAATSGDELSARLEGAGAAELAAPGDRAGLAAAIRILLTDKARRDRGRQGALAVAEELRWSRVAEPLVEWVLAPTVGHVPTSLFEASPALWRMYAFKSMQALGTEGPGALLNRVRRFRDRAR